MATLNIVSEDSLLIVSVSGDVTADEVIAVIKDYYPNGIVKDVIWEFTHGSMRLVTREEFAEIAKTTKESLAGGLRQGGQTVFVGNSTVEYGLLRMYTAIAEIAGVQVKYNVFKTIAEAKCWLDRT